MKEENQLSVEQSTEQTEPVCSEINNKYFDEALMCKVSKSTAIFIACIRMAGDLYSLFCDGVAELYGGDRVDGIIDNGFGSVNDELSAVLYDFLESSINENIHNAKIVKI